MSKTLIKIVDASLMPAALMVVGKLVGLYLTVEVFNFDWGIENRSGLFFSTRPVLLDQDLQIASSYSDLFLLAIMLGGFSLYLTRALFFHSSHVDPKLVTRLASYGKLHLIKDSFEIYNRASMWLLFLWLSNALVIINTFMGKTYMWVALVGVVSTVIVTIMLLRDVAYEVKIIQNKILHN